MGAAKDALCVGVIAGELQFDSAGFVELVLKITASHIERVRTAERDWL